MTKTKIKKGDTIEVGYVLKLSDGRVIEETREDKPLRFEVGSGDVMPGFENALVGMCAGDEKEFTLRPEDAYGLHRKELVKAIPRMLVPKDKVPNEGDVLRVKVSDGVTLFARVVKVDDDVVVLDANHPLAGRELSFKVKVFSVEKKKTKK